jgi:hypothetical protein
MPLSVNWNELEHTFEFVSMGEPHEHEAVICRESGKLFWLTDIEEDIEAWPEDADDPEKYLAIPYKKELDLGKPLVMEFAKQFLPSEFNEVRRMFDRRGAYARFRDLLQRTKTLDRWYDYENKATKSALKKWCALNEIEIAETDAAMTEPDSR